MNREYYVYLMTTKYNTAIYTGITNNIKRRVYEHKEKLIDGFTKKYNVTKLAYYEIYDNVNTAIEREKQIKAGSRKNKIDLISKGNKAFNDLYDQL